MAWTATGGNLKGPKGDKGTDGAKGDAGNGLHIATVSISANSDVAKNVLHPNTIFSVGDVISDVDGTLYQITSIVNASTVHVGNRIDDVTLRGPQGVQGESGKDGKDGTGVNIKGSYDTVEALEAAHPTGAAGDAYLVSGTLYVWDVENLKWANVGDIKGPKGDQGEPGKDGADGTNGTDGLGWTYGHGTPTGDQPIGSLYLNLDTGDVYAYTA